jgi:hypothetical protein
MSASRSENCLMNVISGWIAKVLLTRTSKPRPRRPKKPLAVATPVTPLPLFSVAVASAYTAPGDATSVTFCDRLSPSSTGKCM